MARKPTLSQTISAFLRYEIEDINIALPARVLEYSNEFQKVTVQPLLKERYRDDSSTATDKDQFGEVSADMPPIVGVPVIFPSANNGCINWPIRKGDIVQLLFNQRSLDLWLHTDDAKFNPQTLNTEDNRTHDYSDAVAIPGLYPFKRALGSHPEYFQIRYNVETAQEVSMSMTLEGDLIFDVPGKVKWNCNNWEMYNLGNVKEQISGSVTSRVDGDVREDWNGKYELHHSGTTVERRTGAVTHDYLSTYGMAAAGDIIRQSRGGAINDNASGDMNLQHGGTLDLEGSGVADVPPEEDVDEDLVVSPLLLRFKETHNSSFQYESKFFIVDRPVEGEKEYQFRILSRPNWITLSRPLRPERDSSEQLTLNGFGQDIIVVDLNENAKNLPIGIYTAIIVVEEAEELPNGLLGALINSVTIILEVKP